MILFWVLVAVLVVLALAFVLPPLLRAQRVESDAPALNVSLARERLHELEEEARQGVLDPGRLEEARDELQRNLLAEVPDEPAGGAFDGRRDVPSVVMVASVVPLLALVMYLAIGDRGAVTGVPAAPGGAAQGGGQESLPSVQEMVARLESRLEREPDDAAGWLMLARSYGFIGRWEQAGPAFARAYALLPDDADIKVEYAASLAREANGVLAGRPEALLREALAREPGHLNAQFLLGHAHFQARRPAEALALWEQVAGGLAPGSEDLAQLTLSMNEARAQLGLPVAAGAATRPTPVAAAQPAPGAAAAGGGKSIRVRVDLDPALQGAVEPGATLFVYARATEGPRMPLAITRRAASELPLTVTLDESMAMLPNMTLATFEQVTVEARISSTGNAIPQSGDIRGTRTPVSPDGDSEVRITIDSRVP